MVQLDQACMRLRHHIEAGKKAGHLTQAAVAKAAEVDPGQLSKLLRGPFKEEGLKEPHPGMIFAICKALDLDPHYVWWGEPRSRLVSSAPPPKSDVRPSSRPGR
jgi:transcriptional regulator with XRE-family HTH domain